MQFRTKRPGWCAAAAASLLLLACGKGPPVPGGTTGTPPPVGLDASVAQPQLAVEEDGTLLLVWRHPGEEGSDLYIARLSKGLEFSRPVRINDRPATVSGADLDGLRASVATGPAGLLAVAWSEEAGDVRVALGREHGTVFAPSIRLHQDTGPAMQSFVSIAFDRSGVLHAVWLDTRVSGTSDEEPADVYYARLRDGHLEERNLTDDESPSACGCCRPHIEAGTDGRLGIAFRNDTGDGYRDIHRIDGTSQGRFTPAQRLGPPLWKINGCPMADPLVIGGQTLWNDASTGSQRTLLAGGSSERPVVLLEEEESWRIDNAPRRVAGGPASHPLLLVPGRPSGRLLARAGDDGWRVLEQEVPSWTRSAALLDGSLVIAGSESGALRIETRPVTIE